MKVVEIVREQSVPFLVTAIVEDPRLVIEETALFPVAVPGVTREALGSDSDRP